MTTPIPAPAADVSPAGAGAAGVPTHPCTLVTVVAEPAVEHRLTADLLALGATGYTVVEARGRGARGHAREFPGDNVRVEVVVPTPVAARVLAHLAAHYFADYAVIAYATDVAVVRSDKYDAAHAAPAGPGGRDAVR